MSWPWGFIWIPKPSKVTAAKPVWWSESISGYLSIKSQSSFATNNKAADKVQHQEAQVFDVFTSELNCPYLGS